jgi:hypothetical protein
LPTKLPHHEIQKREWAENLKRRTPTPPATQDSPGKPPARGKTKTIPSLNTVPPPGFIKCGKWTTANPRLPLQAGRQRGTTISSFHGSLLHRYVRIRPTISRYARIPEQRRAPFTNPEGYDGVVVLAISMRREVVLGADFGFRFRPVFRVLQTRLTDLAVRGCTSSKPRAGTFSPKRHRRSSPHNLVIFRTALAIPSSVIPSR